MSAPRKIWAAEIDGKLFVGGLAHLREDAFTYHHDDVLRELAAEIERLRMPSIDDGFALAHFHDGWNEALDAVSAALAKIAQEG